MRKNSRSRNNADSQYPRKRTLRLAPETLRTLTATELPLVVGGDACPTGSWPSADPTLRVIC